MKILTISPNKISDEKKNKNIKNNKKNIFNTNRNSDLVEAMMEFGALVCNSKIPKCEICPIKKNCKFYKSKNKIKQIRKEVVKENINIFCYLSKKGEIALTKKNNLGFLNKFNLPKIESIKNNKKSELYPLNFVICKDCMTSQIDFTIPKEKMFVEHSYMSGTTKTLRNHFPRIPDLMLKSELAEDPRIIIATRSASIDLD